MNPGLVFLLKMGPRAQWRRLRRRVRGPKGAAVAAAAIFLLLLIVGPQIVAYAAVRNPERVVRTATALRTWAPAILLFFVLLIGVSRGALYFRPAEIQFLFTAPVGRRQLLLYNVLSKLRVQILSGLWFGIFVMQHASLWYASFIASFLFLAFLQLTAQASGLALALIDERLSRWFKRLGLGLLLLAVIGGLVLTRSLLPAEASFSDALRSLVESPAVRGVTLITRPFIEVFVASTPVGLLRWALAATAILGLLLATILGFDVAYTEGAVGQARKIQRLLRRARSGGGALAATGSVRMRFALPAFPSLGGAGTMAWRQCQELTRNLAGVLRIALFIFIWIGIFVLPSAFMGRSTGTHRETQVIMPLIMIILMSPMMTMHLAFDFRRDLDRMTFLKSLPVRPLAMACGQVFAMTVLLGLLQIGGVIVIAAVTGGLPPEAVAGLALIVFPLDWAISAVDNTLFLLMPYRSVGRDPGSHPFVGRLMVVALIKMLAIVLIGGIAALGGYGTWVLSGSLLLTGLGAALLLAGGCVPLTLWLAAAFQSFDTTKDLPD